jgi:P-type Ca2+ transporter type 2C
MGLHVFLSLFPKPFINNRSFAKIVQRRGGFMWYDQSTDEVIKALGTNSQDGLSTVEAEKRKEIHGLNKLIAKKQRGLIQMIMAQLNSVLIYILLGAAIISALAHEPGDSIIIAIVIIINAVVGVLQESKAEKALDALKQLSTPKAIVKRDGELKEMPSAEVVPGDIVIIDAGRYVPCDLRLIESANLKIEESALTGESVAVEKCASLVLDSSSTSLGDQKNMAFMSTLATYGRGVGVAVGTGMNTQIGKIARMLDEQLDETTPLQKKLAELAKLLGLSALTICTLMFIVGWIQGRNLLDMFLISISLAVAAIPEGLPAIVTIVLAMGVQRMIKENAIVRKLPAVETLGAVNIICSDKTGTLTQNKMTVTKFYADNSLNPITSFDPENSTHKLLLHNIMLCNDATCTSDSTTGDPTEIALLEVGMRNNLSGTILNSTHHRVNEVPFDSERKLMTTVNSYSDHYHVYTKGAADNLLKICTNIIFNGEVVPLTDDTRASVMSSANAMSDNALRVLGAAYKSVASKSIKADTLEKDLIFIGLIGMIDPPREEAKASIGKTKLSGIKTIMITGDHKNTAFSIAKELGIAEGPSQVLSGSELDSMTEEDLAERTDNLRVFARVSPEHKVKIVKAFKAKGNIVSMTGDGVNDAPSLKMADIGVAMGVTGTDVAKGASDIILTDDNFATIVSAVEEGRNIYNNIRKSIVFLLSCNAGEILALFFAILVGWPAPLKPIHILWVNLVTDTLPALSLGVDPGDPEIMKEKPRNPKASLFSGGAGVNLALNGTLIGFLTLAAYIIGAKMYSGHARLFPLFPDIITDEAKTHAQTMAFVVLSVSQLFHSFNMRSFEKSIFKVGLLSNRYLLGSLIIGVLLQFMVISVPAFASVFKVFPLNSLDWGIVILLSIIPIIVNEIAKLFKGRIKTP